MIEEVRTRTRLPRSSPEDQGVVSGSVIKFIDSVQKEQRELHSLMILRHGHVIAEGWWHPYRRDLRHMLYSLSKSFTSTAVGMAVQEGHLSVADKVISFFPDLNPDSPSTNLSLMTVKDLLTMSTGHETEPNLWNSENWVQGFLAHPVDHVPGTKFLYNTPATYMLSAILHKLTGQSLLNYLNVRLFEPLGIVDATWETSPQGICTGGYGLSVRTEDIAKFGQLYLQSGVWEGKQLVSPDWVAEATSAVVPNGSEPNSDWNQGYGYQFWQCRHNAYRGDGAFGQNCIILPQQDAVIVTTAGLGDLQALLNLCWEHLLSGMASATSLPPSDETQPLSERLAKLELAMPGGASESTDYAPRLNGKTYFFSKNEYGWQSVCVEFLDGQLKFCLINKDGTHEVVAGIGVWVDGITEMWPAGPISACAKWVEKNDLVIRIAHAETPYVNSYTLKFKESGLEMTRDLSASFGPTHFGPVAAAHEPVTSSL